MLAMMMHDIFQRIPLKGLLWGARGILLRNSPTLQSPPCWGIALLLGERQPLLGDNLHCTDPLGDLAGEESTNALCGEPTVSDLLGNINPDSAWETTAVEAANKNIKKIVQKMVVTYRDWHEMLPFALHGYRTSVCTWIAVTPYSLVYGMEVVLPVEVETPSLRVLLDVKLDEAEWIRTRFNELSLIEEKRMAAICHGQLYQSRMKRAFDQKVRPRCFQVGDLVLKRILPPQTDHRGKWTPNYDGPYIVTKVFDGGALMLATMDGENFTSPVNSDAVKKYFA
ncbi:hypothetical protein KIW84_034949 [Lathyrus oleraceus]|uniref:Uncharacterized protein n=1 Tax=Pisum sativum TaxID=3888 RepID=A0A9D4Y1M8_PEA|nr:hypothetical protein KIW84_034949 [Pisum sativum]